MLHSKILRRKISEYVSTRARAVLLSNLILYLFMCWMVKVR